jgi:SAM-dependent methyltransferase
MPCEHLLRAAERLQSAGVHLGSPLRLFEEGGRRQLAILLAHGLCPDSKVLDIGCGSLRAGYWLIHFLDRGCYFGIEPDQAMLNGGLEHVLEPGLAAEKSPRFDGNADFEFGLFGTRFDFFLARSVWTHAPKAAIERMLDGFAAHSAPGASLFASYLPASRWKRDDYRGEEWRFVKSSPAGEGLVRHSLAWIRGACGKRGLRAREVRGPAFDFGGQTWLGISRP